MSIINEALKKAGVAKEAGLSIPQSQDAVRRNLELEFQRRKTSVNWGPFFVLLVLFLITGPIIAPVFSTSFKKGTFSSSEPTVFVNRIPTGSGTVLAGAAVQAVDSTRKAQFSVEETPLFNSGATPPPAAAAAPPSSMPTFNLSGIVYGKDDAYCLINNKIVKIGETVNGAKLIAIKPDQVTLLLQGQEITLTTAE